MLGTAVCYALSSVLVKIIGRTDSTPVHDVLDDLHAGHRLDVDRACPDGSPSAREHYPILIAGVALTGAVGQWGITEAFKRAPAASVAPLEYSGLAWVIVIDLLVWSVVPQPAHPGRRRASSSAAGSPAAIRDRRGAETPP